jgi:hypothetical protein
MRIVVGETGQVLAENADEALNAWARFKGLMLRRGLAHGEGLVIAPCGSIHMMFMRFAIDAVFYDASGRVTKVSSRVRPWIGLAFGGRKTHGVIELPAGGASAVEPGQTLQFER